MKNIADSGLSVSRFLDLIKHVPGCLRSQIFFIHEHFFFLVLEWSLPLSLHLCPGRFFDVFFLTPIVEWYNCHCRRFLFSKDFSVFLPDIDRKTAFVKAFQELYFLKLNPQRMASKSAKLTTSIHGFSEQ